MVSSSMHKKPPLTKLYQQDIVRRVTSPESYGIVMRCWHDAEDVPPSPNLSDPMMRTLKYGEVGVSFLNNGGGREILPESELILVDRHLQPGDYCKRTIDDVRSGVITTVKVKGRLEHVISRERIDGWWTVDDINDIMDAEIGDYVTFDDWIGQVIEVFDESTVEVAGGQLVRFPEMGSRLSVGEKGTNILPPSSGVQGLFGYFLGNPHQGNADRVISVRHSVYTVAWLAVNQSLDASETEKRRRPQRFWTCLDIGKLTLIRGIADLEMRVGDRVYLKHSAGLPTTRHGQEGSIDGVIDVQFFLVNETETVIEVLWQDGVQETLKATDVIPYLNPDEYDCWPGDHVIWKSEDQKRPAVVQKVNAAERTAIILFSDTGKQELASVLELDPHGTSSDSTLMIPQSTSDGLGVRRGDFVFIHPEGTTNGFEKPRVPRIGELEAWVREGPFVDGHFVGWRKELSELGRAVAARRVPGSDLQTLMKRPISRSCNFLWIGEVTNLLLDGNVQVTHPDGIMKVYPLERLTRLYDGIEQLEDEIWDDDGSDSHESYSYPDEPVWLMDDDGQWKSAPENDNNEWEEMDDNEEDDQHEDNEEDDTMNVDPPGWYIKTRDVPESGDDADTMTVADNPPVPSDELQGVQSANNFSVEVSEDEGSSWKRFDVLSCAPYDHAFYSSPHAQPSKSFLGRLNKEYRALASSLPESILVRAYEDRTDLLRSLIIGPRNTPYEDAPFVIDWMLDSNFPHSPPIAHFHSWTNGNGRVNPNLYEEGKVCLSILGTWAGDRNETWSAARSSLLQALVSIQGLVLVKEPWFCEPAYDKLRGTEEGTVNSRLYNEKAFVLSRGFVRRALEIPLGSLESEISWFYLKNRGLNRIVADARKLIVKSKTDEVTLGEQDLAVPRLTAGGIITLERTLNKLDDLLTANQTSLS